MHTPCMYTHTCIPHVCGMCVARAQVLSMLSEKQQRKLLRMYQKELDRAARTDGGGDGGGDGGERKRRRHKEKKEKHHRGHKDKHGTKHKSSKKRRHSSSGSGTDESDG